MASSSSSSLSSLWKHDAFLSFRGEETRKGFVSHLYSELLRKGISTFKDDKKLEKGSSISPNLLKAIENSKFSVVVISPNYASSTWCLDELVKIMECAECGSLTVVPIFYEVDPSDVRKQTGKFAEAFKIHEEAFRDDPERVQRWKRALTGVARLAGEDSRTWQNEAAGIQSIVGYISTRLFSVSSEDTDDLVGIEARMEELAPLLCMESANEVRFIGIWGMGGVGKTTIAAFVYNQHLHQFQAHCFIEVTRIHDIRTLQESFLSEVLQERDIRLPIPRIGCNAIKARLSHLKVLVILDDVDKLDQLHALAKSTSWFGPGSRIVITTRDKHLLVAHRVEHQYEVKSLISDEAHQLFCLYAFGGKHPEHGFEDLSFQVVRHTAGLPLALKVLGSFLCGRTKGEWESALCELRNNPNDDVMKVLKVSYDSLNEKHKSLFLLIACLFNHSYFDEFKDIMHACDYCTEIGIRVLVERALLEISNGVFLKMHDLLQQMGRKIVHQQSIDQPGKRQFLMDTSDIYDVLTNGMGTEAVEGILLDLFETDKLFVVKDKAFESMPNLQFLIVEAGYVLNVDKMHLPTGLSYLPSKLKFFRWWEYPLKALPSAFHPESLVILELRYSKLQKLWEGTQPLTNLRVMNVEYSKNLKELPDLSTAINLEHVDLACCESLVEVPPSIQCLNKLISLILHGCRRLKYIPNINSRCLGLLNLNFCSCLRSSPKISNSLGSLELSGSNIEEFSPLITNLSCLVNLSMANCKRLRSLPTAVENMIALENLDLRFCEMLENLPNTVGKLKALKKLQVSGSPKITKFPHVPGRIETLMVKGTSIEEVPSWIKKLFRLSYLNLSFNKSLISIPISIFKLSLLKELYLEWCLNLESFSSEVPEPASCLETITEVPASITNLSCLDKLDMQTCKKLRYLPNVIGTLTALRELDMRFCGMLEELPNAIEKLESLISFRVSDSPRISKFPRLPGSIEELIIKGTSIEEVPLWIERLSRLRYLDLSFNTSLKSIPISMIKWGSLKELHLEGCLNLESFDSKIHEGTGNVETLKEVPALICNNSCLVKLGIQNCQKLRNLPRGIEDMTTLKEFDLSCCEMLEDLPDTIEKLVSLSSLRVNGSPRITKFPCLPGSIEELMIKGTSIEEVPSWIEKLTRLRNLNLSSNTSLKKIPVDIFRLDSLKKLDLSDCPNLESIPPEEADTTDCLEILDSGGNQVKGEAGTTSCLESLDGRGNQLKGLPTNLGLFTHIMHLYAKSTTIEQDQPSFNIANLTILQLGRNSYKPDGIPFHCPPLSTFMSLKELYLPNLNMPEISDDLGDLGNVTLLDLSGNDFDRIPVSIKHLLHLKTLKLNSFKKLRYLPELPESLECLFAHGCILLEEASSGFKHHVDCLALGNCFKLHQDFELLEGVLHGLSSRILLPGSQVPGYLNHKAAGPSVTISLSQSRTVSEIVGFDACLVITIEGSTNFCRVSFQPCCSFKAKLGGKDFIVAHVDIPVYPPESIDLESEHLFLFEHYFKSQIEEHADMEVANDELIFEFSLESDNGNTFHSLKVKECGIHLIYNEDAEDSCDGDIAASGCDRDDEAVSTERSAIKDSEGSWSSLLQVGLPGVVETTQYLNRSLDGENLLNIKRCRDPEYEGNGDSDEAEKEEPYSKRVKFIEFL